MFLLLSGKWSKKLLLIRFLHPPSVNTGVTTPLCWRQTQVKVTVSRCAACPACAPPPTPAPAPPPPPPSSTYKAVGFGCCGSGCGSSYCQPGTGWRSWRRKAEESGCRWWGNRAGGAGTLDPSGMRAVGRCGSDSGQRRVGGGSAEPAVPPAGCVARTLVLLSTERRREDNNWSFAALRHPHGTDLYWTGGWSPQPPERPLAVS